MAGDRDAGVDPRFDPVFQRGYDPAKHGGRRPRAAATARDRADAGHADPRAGAPPDAEAGPAESARAVPRRRACQEPSPSSLPTTPDAELEPCSAATRSASPSCSRASSRSAARGAADLEPRSRRTRTTEGFSGHRRASLFRASSPTRAWRRCSPAACSGSASGSAIGAIGAPGDGATMTDRPPRSAGTSASSCSWSSPSTTVASVLLWIVERHADPGERLLQPTHERRVSTRRSTGTGTPSRRHAYTLLTLVTPSCSRRRWPRSSRCSRCSRSAGSARRWTARGVRRPRHPEHRALIPRSRGRRGCARAGRSGSTCARNAIASP